MSEWLTKDEAAWLKKVNKLMAQCPSTRLGFYTIGDPCVVVYDRSVENEINTIHEKGGEFGSAVQDADAWLGDIKFPANVHSTSG